MKTRVPPQTIKFIPKNLKCESITVVHPIPLCHNNLRQLSNILLANLSLTDTLHHCGGD